MSQLTTTTPPPFDCRHIRFHTDAQMKVGNGPMAGQWFCQLAIKCVDCGTTFGIINNDGKTVPSPWIPIRPL